MSFHLTSSGFDGVFLDGVASDSASRSRSETFVQVSLLVAKQRLVRSDL